MKEVIEALERITGEPVDVQLKSVLRGAEPEKTNRMLYLMGDIGILVKFLN